MCALSARVENKKSYFCNKVFWTLGISAVLGLGKANSQNTDVQYPDHPPRATETIVLDNELKSVINMADSISIDRSQEINDIQNFIINNYQHPSVIKDFLANYDFIKIIEEQDINSDDSRLPVAYYNLSKGAIHVRYFISPTFEQSVFNSRMPYAFIHELKHFKDINFNCKYFFTAKQLITGNMHEEIVARIAEIILGRNIALKTKDVDASFRHLIGDNLFDNSRMPEANRADPFKNYKKYLKKNLPHLDNKISSDEADILINTAIAMFDIELIRNYRSALVPIIHTSAVKFGKEFQKILKNEISELHIVDYEQYISEIWVFDNQNLLDLCSIKTKNKVNKLCDDFYSGAISLSRIRKSVNLYENHMASILTILKREKEND